MKFIKENIIELIIEGRKYILKRIQSLTEYLIQKDLSELKLPIIQKSSKLFYSYKPVEVLLGMCEYSDEKNKDKFYILMKYIEGKPIKYILESLSTQELDAIVQIIFWSLKMAWNKFEFVHLDLHLNNILVKKLNHPITILLDTDDQRLEIQTNWLPILIDFENSITKRYPNELLQTRKTVLNDIWTFLGSLSLYIKDQEQYQVILNYLSYFIDPMIFQDKKELYAQQEFRVLP